MNFKYKRIHHFIKFYQKFKLIYFSKKNFFTKIPLHVLFKICVHQIRRNFGSKFWTLTICEIKFQFRNLQTWVLNFIKHRNYINKIIDTQVRITKGDNTAQYWPNLGSQESAIVIGPVSLFASVKCWAVDGDLFRLFKFTDLQPKLSPVSALYQADCHFYYGIQFWK